MYRPPNWNKLNPYPCEGCPNIQVDSWGYLCDLACGKRTAYFNREAGADKMMQGLFEMAQDSPTETFVVDSREVNIYSRGINATE